MHTPGREQVAHLRGLVGAHGGQWVLRVGARLIRLRERIDEGDDVAAAQRVLVDGELSGRRKVLGVHQHQHVDVRVDLVGGRREGLYVEQLLRLLVGDPTLGRIWPDC